MILSHSCSSNSSKVHFRNVIQDNDIDILQVVNVSNSYDDGKCNVKYRKTYPCDIPSTPLQPLEEKFRHIDEHAKTKDCQSMVELKALVGMIDYGGTVCQNSFDPKIR